MIQVRKECIHTARDHQNNIYHLDIAAPNHHSIHLFKRELGSLGDIVLNERKPLVLVGNRIPGQVHAFDRSEWQERLLDRVLLDLEVDTADVDPGTCGRW